MRREVKKMKARAVNNGIYITLETDERDENEIWISIAETRDLVIELLRAINSVSPSIFLKIMKEVEGDL